MLQELEKSVISQLLVKEKGEYLLQIGGPLMLCKAQFQKFQGYACIEALPSTGLLGVSVPIQGELSPLLPDSIDVIVLGHQLSTVKNPDQLLSIVYQLLKVNGLLILVEFNRYAIFTRSWSKSVQPQFSGQPYPFLAPVFIKEALLSFDFQLISNQTVGFRPPRLASTRAGRYFFMEVLGQLLCPSMGVVSIMSAQKTKVGMTPAVEASWLRRFGLTPQQTVGTSI